MSLPSLPAAARARADAGLTRLQARGTARVLYPYRAGLELARRRAELVWSSDARTRDDALRSMELVVGATRRAHEVEELARRHVFERYKRYELLARPRTSARYAVEGLEHLLAREPGGPGAIISFLHHGHFAGMCPSLERHGVALTVVSQSVPTPAVPPTVHDLRRRQLRATITLYKATLVEAQGSYATVARLLREGHLVAIAADLPGSTPVRFLGRDLVVPSGAVRLALETGAPIVPVTACPDGPLQRVVVQPPLHPGRFDDAPSLLQAVFDRHAPAALTWPEGLERPLLHFQEAGPAVVGR